VQSPSGVGAFGFDQQQPGQGIGTRLRACAEGPSTGYIGNRPRFCHGIQKMMRDSQRSLLLTVSALLLTVRTAGTCRSSSVSSPRRPVPGTGPGLPARVLLPQRLEANPSGPVTRERWDLRGPPRDGFPPEPLAPQRGRDSKPGNADTVVVLTLPIGRGMDRALLHRQRGKATGFAPAPKHKPDAPARALHTPDAAAAHRRLRVGADRPRQRDRSGSPSAPPHRSRAELLPGPLLPLSRSPGGLPRIDEPQQYGSPAMPGERLVCSCRVRRAEAGCKFLGGESSTFPE
jgi:hypothetical protein